MNRRKQKQKRKVKHKLCRINQWMLINIGYLISFVFDIYDDDMILI